MSKSKWSKQVKQNIGKLIEERTKQEIIIKTEANNINNNNNNNNIAKQENKNSISIHYQVIFTSIINCNDDFIKMILSTQSN